MERKYKTRGYQDKDRGEKKEKRQPRPPEPRPQKHDMLGPHTPRMVANVVRARCSNCGAVLGPGYETLSQCPRCKFELHSCKQCLHFDSGAQFECTQPIKVAIPRKDARNTCKFFEFRMTFEKDTAPVSYANPAPIPTGVSRPNDARRAFEDLFKK